MTAFYAWDGDGGDWNFFEIHTDWHIHTVIPYCVRLYGMWSVRLPISSSYIIRCLVNSIFVWIQFSIVAIVVRWSPLGIRSTMQKIWPEISLDNRAPSDVWWINARIAVAARVVWGQISGLWTVTSCSVQIFQIVCLKILESSLILPTQHIFVCFHSSRKHEIIRLSTDVDNSHTGSIRTPSTAFLWNTPIHMLMWVNEKRWWYTRGKEDYTSCLLYMQPDGWANLTLNTEHKAFFRSRICRLLIHFGVEW